MKLWEFRRFLRVMLILAIIIAIIIRIFDGPFFVVVVVEAGKILAHFVLVELAVIKIAVHTDWG